MAHFQAYTVTKNTVNLNRAKNNFMQLLLI